MKVYDYLTLNSNTIELTDYLDYTEYLEDNFGIANIITEFYNQPFTPELITKFFKGWKTNKCVTRAKYKYYTDDYEISFKKEILTTKSENIHIKTIYINYDNYTWVEMPIVLNDFIRDCIRKKIELEI